MAPRPITAADHARFLGHLARRDRTAAARQAFGLLETGLTVQELVPDLLGPAQAEVGRRWETDQWSVADEHAATAISDAVLAALAWQMDAPDDQGQAVVTCAEGEWHSLPARMAAEVLRLQGWQVTFLGASTPADHLRRFLTEVRPAGVLISCSVPIYLAGAHRPIQAAQLARTPALVGGRAFGPVDLRARRLGADGWATTASAAAQLLTGWAQHPPTGRQPDLPGPQRPGTSGACRGTAPAGPGGLEPAVPALSAHSRLHPGPTRADQRGPGLHPAVPGSHPADQRSPHLLGRVPALAQPGS